MSLYPVTVEQWILINHDDGQPYMFLKSFGGGAALLSRDSCVEQIGEAARHLAVEHLDGNMKTCLSAKVEIDEGEFTVLADSIELTTDYDFHNRPTFLDGESANLKMDYGHLRS